MSSRVSPYGTPSSSPNSTSPTSPRGPNEIVITQRKKRSRAVTPMVIGTGNHIMTSKEFNSLYPHLRGLYQTKSI